MKHDQIKNRRMSILILDIVITVIFNLNTFRPLTIQFKISIFDNEGSIWNKIKPKINQITIFAEQYIGIPI